MQLHSDIADHTGKAIKGLPRSSVVIADKWGPSKPFSLLSDQSFDESRSWNAWQG